MRAGHATRREKVVAAGNGDTTSPEFRAAQAALARLSAADDRLETLTDAERAILQVIAGDGAGPAPSYSFLHDPETMEPCGGSVRAAPRSGASSSGSSARPTT